MKKILIATSEAGSSRILAHLAKKLIDLSFNITVLVNGRALSIFEAESVGYMIPEKCGISNINCESLKKYIQNEKFDLVITGIIGSKLYGIDNNVILAAKMLNVAAITYLDSWCNYSDRLMSIDGQNKFEYLSDVLILMNKYALKKLKDELPDLPDNKVKIIGHSSYYYLLNKIEEMKKAKKPRIGIGEKILFLSQPIRELYGDKSSASYLGYDQYEIIEKIIKVLEKSKYLYELVIRIHPRDSFANYGKYINENVKVDSGSNINDLILDADLVLGMSTTLLIDSILFGKPVGIIQIGLKRGKDLCVLSESGFMTPITNSNGLNKFISNFFNNKKYDGEVMNAKRNNLIKWLELEKNPVGELVGIINGLEKK